MGFGSDLSGKVLKLNILTLKAQYTDTSSKDPGLYCQALGLPPILVQGLKDSCHFLGLYKLYFYPLVWQGKSAQL